MILDWGCIFCAVPNIMKRSAFQTIGGIRHSDGITTMQSAKDMMKKAIALTISFIVIFTMVFAAENEISLSDAEGEIGNDIHVVLSMTGSAATGSITIEYDNSKLEFVRHKFSDDFNIVSPQLNPQYEENQVKFNWLSMNESINFKDCCELVFKIKAGASNTQITVAEYKLYDIEGNNIPTTIKNADVKIAGQENPGSGGSGEINSRPSVTRTPTETPKQADPIATAVPTENSNTTKFTDLTDYEWAMAEIDALNLKGIIKGVSDTEFQPQSNIKRADYIILLVRMLGLKANFNGNFSDIAEQTYYYNEIGIAKELGLTTGIGDDKFNPEQEITRQDMFVLAYRILEMKSVVTEEQPDNGTLSFDDYGEIADYAKMPLSFLVKNEIIKGNENMLYPVDYATRAETAVFIYRLDDFIRARSGIE